MKQIVLVALIALGTLNLSAKGITAPDYVSTNFGTFFYETVREGFGNSLVSRNSDGETLKFDKSAVNSYKSKGRVYDRKPMIFDGKPSSETTFMELMFYRHGVHVYRDLSVGDRPCCYHLFKGDDYLMTMNAYNQDYVLDFLSNNHTR